MIEFLTDRKDGYRMPVWSYKCQGKHQGPPVVCFVYNPRIEFDEDGAFVEYDKKEWEIPTGVTFHPEAEPDDHDPAECADDYYWDVDIRDDIRDSLCH